LSDYLFLLYSTTMKNQLDICPRLQMQQPIYVEEIAWLEGINNYTMVYFLNGRKLLVSKTLRTFDDILPTNDFLRINRQVVIRINHISAWRTSNRTLTISLNNGPSWAVSRRKLSKVKHSLIEAFDRQLWQNKYNVAA
jgi:DNA-binding LytR/AlgR family response regulator